METKEKEKGTLNINRLFQLLLIPAFFIFVYVMYLFFRADAQRTTATIIVFVILAGIGYLIYYLGRGAYGVGKETVNVATGTWKWLHTSDDEKNGGGDKKKKK